VTVVDFYRKLLDIERRRFRWSVPVMFFGGLQLCAILLASKSVIPSFRSRLLLAVGSVVAVSVMAAFAQWRLARRHREIRDLSDDT
jgi:predicted ATP-grasp superfamily ATP-dependent carboligase